MTSEPAQGAPVDRRTTWIALAVTTLYLIVLAVLWRPAGGLSGRYSILVPDGEPIAETTA